MTLPHHQPLQELGLISSAALIQAHAAAQAQAQANATQSAGGSGSVVYENSYNSFQRLPPGSCMGQLPSTVSQDLLSASAGGATNADDSIRLGDNQNSTPSTTNGGGGVGGVAEPLAKSPSVAAMVSANSPSALVTSPLMNFYETAGGSTGGTYVTHPANLGAMVNVQRVGKPGSPGATGSPSGARSFWRCSWQYWVILICVLAFLLAVSFAVFFSENAKWLENRLHEKYTQDPAIFGLFNPDSPPHKIEPNTQVKVRLDPMGLWAGHWLVLSELCTIYNLTVTSELSSIGIFLRYSTMPTIVHYNHFDRILGRQLKTDAEMKKSGADLPREAFPSVPSASHGKLNSPRTTGRVRCLKKGHWFISLVNDQPRTEDVVISMAEIVMLRGCPNDCSNRGICSQGVCDCLNGLTGKDCSSIEEVPICSGHGDYRQGKCHCYAEWKGPECELLWSECPEPTCSGNGRCVTGECLCFDGYGGDACQFRTCGSHNCSGNGVCIDGVCRCFAGWDGAACDRRARKPDAAAGDSNEFSSLTQKDAVPPSPPPDPACSLNGHRDPVKGTCRCFPGFEGPACEKDVTCSSRCVHGVCTGDRRRLLVGGAALPGLLLPAAAALIDPAVCHCHDGWRGVNCDLPTCHAKCLLNGHCINDTCVCNRGWSGANCNLNECPLDCSGQGQCVQGDDGHYFCQCFANRKGSACQVSREISCNDGRDDDQDGLVDCLDPDCCGTEHCEELIRLRGSQQAVEDARQSCAHSTEISGLILSTKMAAPGSSFSDQLEFLLLRDLTTDKVNPRRVSVVRGVVRQWDSTPFWGCRVFDRLNPAIGSALTDKSGRFELVVDGGFLVQLEFIRHPTSRFTAHLDVYVPVNQIVNIGDFYLMDSSSATPTTVALPNEGAVVGVGGILPSSPIFSDLWVAGLFPTATPKTACPPGTHDVSALGGPMIEPTSGVGDANGKKDDDLVICLDADKDLCISGGVLSHRFPLKASSLHLVHNTDKTERSRSFLTVNMLSTGRSPPEQLAEVHLSIDVAGLRQSWRFEPSQGLDFTFVWNRTDGYNRPVYGRVPAKVSVGFLYADCPTVFWEHRVAYMDGHDISPSDLGRWSLDARHTFSPNQGIVYRGDGSRLVVGDKHLVVGLVLGKPNVRRSANRCEMCLGKARGNPIFRAAALATDETGRLLVGDGHYLRYLQTDDYPRSSENMGSFSASFDASAPDGSSSDAATSQPRSSDWLVADVRPMAFIDGGVGEDDWPVYHIARHPISSEELEALSRGGIGGGRAGVFISDTRNKTIWWTSLVRRDFSQMVISEQCPPNNTYSDCLRMPLVHPKGLVVTYNEDLFFIDDKSLWRYQLRRTAGQKPTRAELVIGQLDSASVPMSCERSLPTEKVKLVNPSVVGYNPVEDSIYYVDDKCVFRLHLASRMVSLAAGRLPGCKASVSTSSSRNLEDSKAPMAVDVEFTEVRGIAFSSLGELYIAESEVIWIRRSDGRLYPFAGTKTSAPWSQPRASVHLLHPSARASLPFDQSTLISEQLANGAPVRDFRFANITAIAVGIYDEVFVADAGHNVVVGVRPEAPKLGPNNKYTIKSGLEVYVFDKQGQLESVVDALTQYPVYSLTFNANGWLSSVKQGPMEMVLAREPLGLPQQMAYNTGEAYNLSHSSLKREFESILDPYGGLQRYKYNSGGQLSKLWTVSSALPYIASYSASTGLLESILLPSGGLFAVGMETQKVKGRGKVPDVFLSTVRRQVLVDSSSSGEVVKLTYAGGAHEVVFERVDPPLPVSNSNNDHASWQIARRIRMYVQPQSPNHFLVSDNGGAETAFNASAQAPRLIENLVVSSFDIFGLKQEYLQPRTESTVRQRRFSWFAGGPFSSSLFPGRARRDIATEASVQKTRKTLSINGQPVLSVTLDRESRTETFRSPVSDKLLLQITYNDKMQPIGFATHPSQATSQSGFADVSNNPDFGAAKPRDEPVLASLRIMYTPEGQLREAFWGRSNYRLSYDSKKRLRTAEIGSALDTLAFDYQNVAFPHLPTEVSVSGAGTYRLVYKQDPNTGENGLSHLITPLGLHRVFALFTSIGVDRLTLTPWALEVGPTSSSASFTYDWETRIHPTSAFPGSPLARFTWPSGRRVNVLQSKRLIVYDNTLIHWDVDELSETQIVSLHDALAEFKVKERRTFGAGTLVTHVRGDVFLAGTSRVPSNLGGLLAYSHEYEYDHSFRVYGIRSCLFKPKSHSPLWCHRSHITYHNWAGYSISPLSVNFFQEGHLTTVTWTQGALKLSKRTDSRGRLLSVVLEREPKHHDVLVNATFVYGGDGLDPSSMNFETLWDVPRSTHYRRGPGGRVEGIDYEEIGSSRRRHVQVVYNEESRVSDLRHYISDSQFASLGGSESKRISTKFSYERGLVSGFGNWKYVFDEDGCLVERRLRDNGGIEDLFEYDSKGLLRWVERRVSLATYGDHAKHQPTFGDSFCSGFESVCYPQELGIVKDYSIQFMYDAEDRLVVVRNTLSTTDMVQYFYAHPQNPDRLTSFFHYGKGKAYFLNYEQQTGHLFAVEEVDLSGTADSNPERKVYLVVTDSEGSPISLFSDDKLLWTAEYSATGGRRLMNRDVSLTQLLDDLVVPLGYRGAVLNPHTGFLFAAPTWQAYDPMGATLTSPDWRRAPTLRLRKLHSHPQALDLHLWLPEDSNRNPLVRLQEAIRSPTWWLRRIDQDIDRLFPRFQPDTGAVSAPSAAGKLDLLPTKCRQGVLVSSKRLQQANQINEQLERLGIVNMGQLAPDPLSTLFDDACPMSRIKVTSPIFGTDVSFALSLDGTVSVLPCTNTTVSQAARVLLSGAKLMDSWYLPTPSHGGLAAVTSFVQLFVKVTPSLDTDLAALRLQRSQLLSPASVRLSGNASPLSGVRLSLDNSAGVEMRITSAGSSGVEWRLRYADSWAAASARVLQEAKRRGILGVQRRAASRVGPRGRGPRTSPKPWPPWPSASPESKELEANNGEVKGYVWEPVIREPKRAAILSELLDDPAIYQLRPANAAHQKKSKAAL
uniref:EGF-like domain-containing protein n=1 Tax=Mesocestoides corti TaxID=53468 RepID=A0A5K3EJB5_MESCO